MLEPFRYYTENDYLNVNSLDYTDCEKNGFFSSFEQKTPFTPSLPPSQRCSYILLQNSKCIVSINRRFCSTAVQRCSRQRVDQQQVD